MGSWGAGPFENDHALDLIGRLLDSGSPARVLRDVLGNVQRDGYLDIDDVAAARAACALVGVVVTRAEGVDVASTVYEAAARLRLTQSLLRDCLAVLPLLLDQRSELFGLLDERGRRTVGEEIERLRLAFEEGLTTKLKALPKAKVKTVQAYAIPVGALWMAFVWERHGGIAVLDRVWEEPPAGSDLMALDVLFRCVLIGNPSMWEPIESLGRISMSDAISAPWTAVHVSETACTGSPTSESFATYLLERGTKKYESAEYEVAASLPNYRWVQRAELVTALEQHLASETIDLLRVPSPEERRAHHITRCLRDGGWRDALDGGTGGGPFDFTAVIPSDAAPYVRHWLAQWVTPGEGPVVSVPDQLMRWMLIGLVAATIAPGSQAVPESLRSAVEALKGHVGKPEVRGALKTLEGLTDPEDALMVGLADDKPRQKTFLREAERVRVELKQWLGEPGASG